MGLGLNGNYIGKNKKGIRKIKMQMTFGWLVCLTACLQLVAASEEEQATTLPKLTVFTVATQKTDGYLRYGYYPRIGSKCFDLT